jgi:hypothetical protein
VPTAARRTSPGWIEGCMDRGAFLRHDMGEPTVSAEAYSE